MNRIPLVCLFALVISGCSEGEPPVPDSSKAPAPVSEPGLPMISEELLEGSVAMDLMAVTRRLDEITGSYATKKAIQPQESEGMQQDLERLQKAKPLASETVLFDECLALLKDVLCEPAGNVFVPACLHRPLAKTLISNRVKINSVETGQQRILKNDSCVSSEG